MSIYMIAALICGVFMAAAVVPAAESKALKTGDKAPAVQGKDQDGKAWRLADSLGKKLVLLYFYPKDNTPGCTAEACGLRDRMEELNKQSVEVVGVSFDSAESHKKFIAQHSLNFRLLADEDGKIADAFGARKPGKDSARRVSFLIGTDGKIKHITDSTNVDTHLTEMKDAIAKEVK